MKEDEKFSPEIFLRSHPTSSMMPTGSPFFNEQHFAERRALEQHLAEKLDLKSPMGLP